MPRSPASPSRCSRAATCCSRACPASRRPCSCARLSHALKLDTKRVQFTPDLMPGDVTGSLVYDAKAGEFEFREGPVFTNILLADEINRTPPKTQSALLEAMEERQVSVDGVTRKLPVPFMVAATMNPIEYEGTYTLPEAQLDRFLLKLVLDLPERDNEVEVLTRHAAGFNPRDLAAAGRHRRARRRRSSPQAQAAVAAGRRQRRRDRLRRRPRPRDPAEPLGQARREPAWRRPRCSPPRRRGPGSTASTRSPPTTCRPWRCPCCATASSCGPRRSSRASRPTRSCARSCSRCRCRSNRWHVTGWFVARSSRSASCRSSITGEPVVLLAAGSLLRVVLGVVDLAARGLAAHASRSRATCPGAVRLGETVDVDAATSPTPGAAACAASCATAGSPRRARLRDARRARHPRRRAPRHHDDAHPVPPRGAPRGPRDHPVVRPAAALARQATIAVPGAVPCCPRSTRASTCPSRLARLRELDGATSVMVRGQGTEFDSLRDYVRGDDVRSIDWRATPRAAAGPRRAHLAARARPPGRDHHRQRPHLGRPHRQRAAHRHGVRVGAAARRPRLERRRPRRPRRSSTAGCAARVQGATGAELLSRMVVEHGARRTRTHRDGLVGRARPRALGDRRTAPSSCSPPRSTRPAPRAGCCRCCRSSRASTPWSSSSVTDPTVLDATRDRTTRDEVYRAAAAERALLDQARVAAAMRQLGGDVVTGAPQDLPPALADRYIALKAAGQALAMPYRAARKRCRREGDG